ncbi:MAG: precorrin-3B C(17)-methyltransferase [Nitrospinae bacterium]|nr:precorrin-3B C(17)-methyltransferase [Nitrospinota bacterium]
MSKLYIIGIGPGAIEQMTLRAREAIGECDVIVGYKTYVRLIECLASGKEVISLGMTEEIERARKAVELALEGKVVGLVSSGDAGVYGMAGLALEALKERQADTVAVEVVPGVPALCAAASLLGAPLGHDFAAISLSDLLTEWKTIEKRIMAAAESDFIIVLYNPKSGKRTWQLERAREIILGHRPGTTPVGLVTSAYREGEKVVLTDLERMLSHEAGMLTTVIIGNLSTYIHGNKLITPRGYQKKYGPLFPE